MLDSQVTQLLETAINTSCKLAIILHFLDQRQLCVTPNRLAERLGRDIWSIETALQELAEDGIVSLQDGLCCYAPSAERHAQLQALRQTYDHPLQRDELHGLLRELERYAPYRKEVPDLFLQSRVV